MQKMRLPGIEPGLQAWEARVITAGPQPLWLYRLLMSNLLLFALFFGVVKLHYRYKVFSAFIKWILSPLIWEFRG
jgi:hypothetical protein